MIKSSPSAAEHQPLPNRITIGRVGAAQGIHGEMRIIPLTDFPERFKDMREVMVGDELVDWIYENIGDLSNGTRHKLGIIEIPLVIQ